MLLAAFIAPPSSDRKEPGKYQSAFCKIRTAAQTAIKDAAANRTAGTRSRDTVCSQPATLRPLTSHCQFCSSKNICSFFLSLQISWPLQRWRPPQALFRRRWQRATSCVIDGLLCCGSSPAQMHLVSNLQTFQEAVKDSVWALTAVSLHFADMTNANANANATVGLYPNT